MGSLCQPVQDISVSTMALPMKAMKAMKSGMKKAAMKKGMKAMKAMKKGMKAMKVSKIAKGKRARSSVFRGTKEKTTGGLTKATLTKSKSGKIVSKAASAASKKKFA